LAVEMLLAVRQGDSDIFVVSQSAEANCVASTAWPETYAVAEAKFFRHIARQVPCDSLHLKCLQVFTSILRGTGFSSSVWKTVVMHVLTTLKRLEHFVLGNERLPAEISLPPAMSKVEPLNLFEHLARDPGAHREAVQ
ncbi:IPIL1 protein, partial [Scopus umbretta]|nr:IPIL1 protein [Scopus umbretta]